MMKMTQKQIEAIRAKRVYRDAGERFQVQKTAEVVASAPVSEFVLMVQMLGSAR